MAMFFSFSICRLLVILAAVLSLSAFSHASSNQSPSKGQKKAQSTTNTESEPTKTFSRSLTIFVLPPTNLDNGEKFTELQHRTIRSLIRIRPRPRVLLVGNHSSFFSLASEFRKFVSQDVQFDFFSSRDGPGSSLPVFSSVIARALSVSSHFSMVLNSELTLINETALSETIDEASRKFPGNGTGTGGFLLTWPKHIIGQLPPDLTERPTSQLHMAADRDLRRHVMLHGRLDRAGGAGAYLWNNRKALYRGVMPIFAAGRGKFDTWLIHRALVTTNRTVLDGGWSVACASTRRLRSWEGLEEGKDGNGEGKEKERERKEGETWKMKNIGLVRSLRQKREAKVVVEAVTGEDEEEEEGWELGDNWEGKGEEMRRTMCPLRSPWMAKPCSVLPGGGGVCIVNSNCTCVNGSMSVSVTVGTESVLQLSPEMNETLSSSSPLSPSPSTGRADEAHMEERQKWFCEAASPKPFFTISTLTSAVFPDDSPTLEEMLPFMADENKVVILVAVSGGYADMLMNFVCSLRRLGLRDPLIAALDEDLYRFATVQGLPVYLERFEVIRPPPSAEEKEEMDIKEIKCIFGSKCFRAMTKLKSRAVLKILKLGYHVFWSDVDIAWFENPIPAMYDLGPGTFPVQCDEPNDTIPANSRGFPTPYGTINSGFYFARSEPLLIKAFEAIIEHAAARIGQSEQPSFYMVLCGEGQENLVGDDECLWNGLRVVFMSRKLHPNGRVFRLWNTSIRVCRKMGCATLHNNWVKGKDRKTTRFKRRYIWWWDEKTRLCRHNWYGKMVGISKGKY